MQRFQNITLKEVEEIIKNKKAKQKSFKAAEVQDSDVDDDDDDDGGIPEAVSHKQTAVRKETKKEGNRMFLSADVENLSVAMAGCINKNTNITEYAHIVVIGADCTISTAHLM